MGIINFTKRAISLLTVNNTWTGTNNFKNATLSQETTSNGATRTFGWVTELLTLSTGGATTDTTIDLPANSIIQSVVGRVTTTISGGGATSFDVGDPTTAGRFVAGVALTSGTTFVGLDHQKGGVSTDATGPTQASTAKIRVTVNGGTPSAGAVRLTCFYEAFTAPTS